MQRVVLLCTSGSAEGWTKIFEGDRGVDSANLLDIINGYSTFNKENILYLIRNSIVDLEKKASQHIRKMAALEDKSEFDDM